VGRRRVRRRNRLHRDDALLRGLAWCSNRAVRSGATRRAPRQAEAQRVQTLHLQIVARTRDQARTCITLKGMKATSFTIILALGLMAGVAEAQRPHPQGFGGSSFEANKKFGIGLELGEPTGITGKLFLTPNQALDFGI